MPPLGAVPEERCSILASSRCCRAARNLPQVSSHASNSSALLAAEEPQSKEISLSAKQSISLLRPSFARFSYSSTGTAYSTGRTARLQKACKSFPGGLQHAAAPLRAWSGGEHTQQLSPSAAQRAALGPAGECKAPAPRGCAQGEAWVGACWSHSNACSHRDAALWRGRAISSVWAFN